MYTMTSWSQASSVLFIISYILEMNKSVKPVNSNQLIIVSSSDTFVCWHYESYLPKWKDSQMITLVATASLSPLIEHLHHMCLE